MIEVAHRLLEARQVRDQAQLVAVRAGKVACSQHLRHPHASRKGERALALVQPFGNLGIGRSPVCSVRSCAGRLGPKATYL